MKKEGQKSICPSLLYTVCNFHIGPLALLFHALRRDVISHSHLDVRPVSHVTFNDEAFLVFGQFKALNELYGSFWSHALYFLPNLPVLTVQSFQQPLLFV